MRSQRSARGWTPWTRTRSPSRHAMGGEGVERKDFGLEVCSGMFCQLWDEVFNALNNKIGDCPPLQPCTN